MSLNSTPKTWTSPYVVTASDLNTEIRDPLTGIQAAWTSYTPTLTNIVIGNGTVTASYLQIGKTIKVSVLIIAGTTTTYTAGNFIVSLPVAALAGIVNTAQAIGSAIASPGGTRYACAVGFNSSTSVTFALPSGGTVSNVAPATWGTSGILGFTVEYQAA